MFPFIHVYFQPCHNIFATIVDYFGTFCAGAGEVAACNPTSSDLARSCAAATAATTAAVFVPAAALALAAGRCEDFLARTTRGGADATGASPVTSGNEVARGPDEDEMDDEDEDDAASISISSGGGKASVCDAAAVDAVLARA